MSVFKPEKDGAPLSQSEARRHLAAVYKPADANLQAANREQLNIIMGYYPHVLSSQRAMSKRGNIVAGLSVLGLAGLVYGAVSGNAEVVIGSNVELASVGVYEKRTNLRHLYKHTADELKRVNAAIIGLVDPISNPNATPLTPQVLDTVARTSLKPALAHLSLALRVKPPDSPNETR